MLGKTLVSVGAIQFLHSLASFGFGVCLAFFFGASPEMDAYMAVSVFVLSFQGIFLRSQRKTFIPLLGDYNTREEQNHISSLILTANVGFFVGVSLLLIIFSRSLAFVIAPGLSPSQHDIMSGIFKILSVFVLFINVNAIISCVYQFRNRFSYAALIELIGVIAMIITVSIGSFYWGIFSIAAAKIVSVILMFLLLFIPLRKSFRFQSIVGDKNKEVLYSYIKLMIPIFSASIFMWLIRFTDSFVASFLESGSISNLNYALKLVKQPEHLLAFIPMIYFPILSKLNKATDTKTYEKTFFDAFQMILSFSLPLAVFISLNAHTIVMLIFERGSFTSADTQTVSSIIRFYMAMMICAPLGTLFNNAYYSRKKIFRATGYSLASSLTNIVLNFIFAYFFGIKGLAAATSIAYVVGNILQGANLHKAVPGAFTGHGIIKITMKLLLIILVPTALNSVIHFIYSSFEATLFTDIIFLVSQTSVFFGVYFVLCYFMGIKNVRLLASKVYRKFWKRQANSYTE
ncbi:MAG: murein biosynthesis integral membrane protein MurJ [Fibrobacterota bacterium]